MEMGKHEFRSLKQFLDQGFANIRVKRTIRYANYKEKYCNERK